MRPETKKAEKAKKRKKIQHERTKQRDRKALQLRLKQQFPEMVIEQTNADPGFVEAIKTAAARIDFTDTKQFAPLCPKIYKQMKEKGASNVLFEILQKAKSDLQRKSASVAVEDLLFGVGHAIYTAIPEAILMEYTPINNLRVLLQDKQLRLRCSKLNTITTSRGRTFASRHQPRVTIDGSEYVVAFSRHAIQRICERTTTVPYTYCVSGQIHSLLSDLRYFEPVKLRDGQWAIELLDVFYGDMLDYFAFATERFGLKSLRMPKVYRVAGYCPINFDGEIAVATTFLIPGSTKTPEYQAIGASTLPRLEKEQFRKIVSTTDNTDLDSRLDVLNWVTDQGVPQAFWSEERLFDYN